MRIGVDLGGTKIEAIALGDDGAELARRRVAAPQGVYEDTVRAIAGLVGALERETGRTGTVGVGIPGVVWPLTGVVKNANSTWLIGRPLDRDLSAALDRPVRTANDANCFALSEAADGAAAGASIVFGVIIGTGVGGGIVVDGRVLTGANAISGEWGHSPLPPWPLRESPPIFLTSEIPGPPCYCGKLGCVETYLSGPGLARDHQAAGGPDIAAPEIVRRAEAGDAQAEAALKRYELRLARALAIVVNALDPDVIVLGGGMSNLSRLYSAVPELWRPFIVSDPVVTRLVPPAHGDSSGVRGAAWLWPLQATAGGRAAAS
jgi:fructokinase